MSLKIPLRLSSAAWQVVLHCLIVFVLAFAGQVTAGATGAVSMPTFLALLTSAAAAGVTAVVHYALGLVPTPIDVSPQITQTKHVVTKWTSPSFRAVSPVVKSRLYQFLLSVIVTFLSIFGSGLLAGATHVTSFPTTVDVITAALSAAVAGVVTFVVGLLPSPKTTSTPRPSMVDGYRGA